jgi:hypothetical protein
MKQQQRWRSVGAVFEIGKKGTRVMEGAVRSGGGRLFL